MPLSINPITAALSKASETVTEAFTQASDAVSSANKDKLEQLISQKSGELGSGLNALSSQAQSLATGALGSMPGASTIQNAVGGVQNLAGGAISTLQNAASAVSVAGNLGENIAALSKISGGSLATGIKSLAGGLSTAAGMLNNILSLKRGANLPAGAEFTKQTGSAIKLQPGAKDDWRVRITCQWDLFKGNPLFARLSDTGGVVWPYLPNITVSTKADYTALNPTHSNYTVHAYKGSSVEDIIIAGEFSCETESDAAYWIAATTFFKTATKMFYGQGEFAGNPPLVCNLTGYGASIFDKVPIIIKNFSVDLKDDVNYVRCNTFGTNTWVPVMSTISVTVSPVYSRERLRKFNLQNYAAGKMTESGGVGYI